MDPGRNLLRAAGPMDAVRQEGDQAVRHVSHDPRMVGHEDHRHFPRSPPADHSKDRLELEFVDSQERVVDQHEGGVALPRAKKAHDLLLSQGEMGWEEPEKVRHAPSARRFSTSRRMTSSGAWEW